ncbi:hypothetical protein KKF84_10190 [Myxococcota bacterium]|nr:hypothetical protein [Myxococcota bacterium]MBU1535680.1 hypothetical protein [Myxococcota bacterium]
MSFNIGSFLNTAIPMISQAAIMGVGASSPQGMLFSMFLSGQGSAGGMPFMQGMQAFTPFLTGVLGKLAGMTFNEAHSYKDFQNSSQSTGSGGTAASNNSQAKIQSILNGNYSIEEKIILIAGVVSDSIRGELEDCLKEQGKLAKSTSTGQNQATSSQVANTQNVENRIQILMQRLNQMQSTASNMIQAMHTTKKASIMNIRV